MNNNEVIYSHRPEAGVSVGAHSTGAKLFVAIAIVNDGTSRNGNYWEESHDTFSRKGARLRICGRIEKMIGGKNIREGIVFDTDITAHSFMNNFRELFKPTVDESDDAMAAVESLNIEGHDPMPVRWRPAADELFNRVANMANEVVATANNV